jgi:uncharacterized damage-inducible protein DinB
MSTALQTSILDAWRTNNRVTTYLVEHLSPELLAVPIPGAPRRTVRMIAGHIHNARRAWIKTLGHDLKIPVPAGVDRHRVSRRELVAALQRSNKGMIALLTAGCDRGGAIPPSSTYVWRNLQLDVGHVLAYFVAHEAHHRGQIVMAARAAGDRLPMDVTNGLWHFVKRNAEARARSQSRP